MGKSNVIQLRTDGWLNTLTGIGTTRDKRLGGDFTADTMTPDSCEELYRSNDMAARIAEAVPEEMTREWVDFLVDDDQDVAEKVMKVTEELNVQEHFREALSISRALGGAGILMGLDDGMDPAEPADEERVQAIEYMTVMDCRELIPVSWYRDPFDPRCGLPELYQLRPIVPNSSLVDTKGNPTGMTLPTIHETRILRFDGVRTTRRQRLMNRGWGESVYVRVFEVLRDYSLSWASAANLLQDFAQGFLKIKGLAELVATNEDDKIVKRAQLMDLSRSVARMVLLDSEEEFGRIPTPIGGLDVMLDKFALRLAAAARMPVSLLMGQAPAGLNATGDSDVRWFYDQVAAQQRKVILPHLKRITPWLFKMAEVGTVPEEWSWEFKRLWQLTDLEQATLRSTQATTDCAYINAQVLTPEEVAISRFGGDRYSTETTIDVDAREAMKKQREEAMAIELKNKAAQPPPGHSIGPDGKPIPTTALPKEEAPAPFEKKSAPGDEKKKKPKK